MTEAQIAEKKAYDVKVLLAKFKARGLDLAEEAAVMVVEETCDWVVESAVLSKTPYDDILSVAIPPLKAKVLESVDKIDGQEG